MCILKLEMKRVLKTKMTRVLLALALFLTGWLAYMPVTFYGCAYFDESGKRVELTGFDAMEYIRKQQSDLAGEATPEKIRKAVEAYQTCIREYEAEDVYSLPEEVYTERILPYQPLIHGVKEAFADSATGMAPSILDINPEDLDNFYAVCENRISSLMKTEQPKHPAAQEKGTALYQKIEKPFVFYPVSGTERMDYQILLCFLLMFFCAAITAPVFSSDYQTGADDILRCTKHGRIRLACTKIAAALIICGMMFGICASAFVLISNCIFGREWTQTSIQMTYTILALADMTMGQLQWTVVLIGLLSVLATISFTLCISSKCKNTMISMCIAVLFVVLPIVVYMSLPNELGIWIRCILPASSVGIQTSILYQLIDFQFLNIGKLAIWLPYAMVAFMVIEIPLFTGMAIHSYCRHKVN
ncbi:MAG: ABC transporter permease [Lachnospiraceae bacterium]|nr:ABC transporter permease [Lachnospiraceae bacterium]